MSEPRTTAGRALLDFLMEGFDNLVSDGLARRERRNIVRDYRAEQIIAIEREAAPDEVSLAEAMCRTQHYCDGTCPDFGGIADTHAYDAAAIIATLP